MEEGLDLFFVNCDDYTGLYINGKLKRFDDSYNFELRDLTDFFELPVTIKSVASGEVDYEFLDEHGNTLPADLQEVRFVERN